MRKVALLMVLFLLLGMLVNFPTVNAHDSDEDHAHNETDNSGSSDDSERNVCDKISGETFSSIELLEGGLTTDGSVARARWTITFDENEGYSWMYSDVVETGTYSCDGNEIIGTSITDRDRIGEYNVDRKILTWDGIKYSKLSDDGENEIENEDDDRDKDRKRLRIHANIETKIRDAIKARNRLHLNGSDLPPECTKTGAVIRCDLDSRQETRIEVEGVDLDNESQAALDSFVESINGSSHLEIKIKIENKDNDTESEIEVEGSLTEDQQSLLDELLSKLTSLMQNQEEEAKLEIEIRTRFRAARVMIVGAGNSGNTIIKIRNSEFRTRVELYHHNGEVYGRFGDNETRLIDILPDELQDRIRERLRQRLELRNESVELNEEGEYEFEADKHARFLGILKVKEKVRFHVDPETGEILNQRAPWWGFLANDVEVEEGSD